MDDIITVKEKTLETKDKIAKLPDHHTAVVKQEPENDVTDMSHHDMDDTTKVIKTEPMEEGCLEVNDTVSNIFKTHLPRLLTFDLYFHERCFITISCTMC
jgi:hypothetical protein